jgi:hypothetical protein
LKPWRGHGVFLYSLTAGRGVEWHRLDAGGRTRSAADPPGWPTIAPMMRPGSAGLVVHALDGQIGVTVFRLPSPRATGRPLREPCVLLSAGPALSGWQRSLIAALLRGELLDALGECVRDADHRLVIDARCLAAVLDGLPAGAPPGRVEPLAEGVSLDTPEARRGLHRALSDDPAGDGVIAAVSPAASAERLGAGAVGAHLARGGRARSRGRGSARLPALAGDRCRRPGAGGEGRRAPDPAGEQSGAVSGASLLRLFAEQAAKSLGAEAARATTGILRAALAEGPEPPPSISREQVRRYLADPQAPFSALGRRAVYAWALVGFARLPERAVVLRAAVAGAPGDAAAAVDGIVRYVARREFEI